MRFESRFVRSRGKLDSWIRISVRLCSLRELSLPVWHEKLKMTMGKTTRDALGNSCEYLADVDDDADTTCWSLKRQKRLLRKFGSAKRDKIIRDGKIDGVRYIQDQFDSRPVTPDLGGKKFEKRSRSSRHAHFRRNLFPRYIYLCLTLCV